MIRTSIDCDYQRWLKTVGAKEAANTGSLRAALFRTWTLRQSSTTLADWDDAVDLFQGLRDEALYWGEVEGTAQERFEAMVRVVTSYGDDWNAYDADGAYQDFLESPYWKTVAAYVKWLRGGRCQMCEATANLHTHHKTYRHKGSEHKHLDDLVVVCAKCHGNHHGR
jgi:hypothetical protein